MNNFSNSLTNCHIPYADHNSASATTILNNIANIATANNVDNNNKMHGNQTTLSTAVNNCAPQITSNAATVIPSEKIIGGSNGSGGGGGMIGGVGGGGNISGGGIDLRLQHDTLERSDSIKSNKRVAIAV